MQSPLPVSTGDKTETDHLQGKAHIQTQAVPHHHLHILIQGIPRDKDEYQGPV